jgi:Fic family protein
VGTHLPPQAKELPRFLERFNEVYSSQDLDPLMRIIAGAAAHHRLAWIHPFLDGNGRVIRLFSDCLLCKEGLGGFGYWTISRGLARRRSDYYQALACADDKRKNDYDGRGALSDQSLSNCCQFFLNTAIDQVDFMSTILNIDNFEKRLNRFVEILEDYYAIRKESYFLL